MADSKATLLLQLKDFVSKGLTKIGGRLDGLSKKLDKSKLLFAGVSAGIAAAGAFALKAAGQFEQWRISFTTMLGSAERADFLLNKIKKFAAETPFELPQVVEGSKRLLAFGFAADEITDKFRMLGDIAAGVGTDKLPTLILAFGKIRTKGRATMEELNILLEAGVPILDQLAKNYDVTKQEIFKFVSAGKVGFEDVDKALRTLTADGALFGGLMAKQMDSVEGKISNVLDVAFQLRVEFGNFLIPLTKKFAKSLIKAGEALIDLSANKKLLIILIAGLVAGFSGLIASVAVLVSVWGALTAALSIVFATILPIVAILGTLAGVIFFIKDDLLILGESIIEAFKKVKDSLTEWFEWFSEWFVSLLPEKLLEGLEVIAEHLATFREKVTGVMTWIGNKIKSTFKSATDFASKRLSFLTKKLGIEKKKQVVEEKKAAKEVQKTQKELDAERVKRLTEQAKAQAKYFSQVRGLVSIFASQVSDIFGKESKAAFIAQKVAAIAGAIVNTFRGVTLALATIPPPYGFAVAGLVKAMGLAQVAAISSTTIQGLQEGGLVLPRPGGTLARVGEGGSPEAVIPLEDEEAMERLGGVTINVGVLVGTEEQARDFAKMIDQELFDLRANNESIAFRGL